MTSQQLAQHIAALVRKAQHEGTVPEISVLEFTPSIRRGIAYIGVSVPTTDSQFLVEIEEVPRVSG